MAMAIRLQLLDSMDASTISAKRYSEECQTLMCVGQVAKGERRNPLVSMCEGEISLPKKLLLS